MWGFASNALAGSLGQKNESAKLSHSGSECSDDEVSSISSREEGLECPICWESFNIVENVPYVLWCGHTLCKNCVLGLQWAVVKFSTLPIQLPLFISCPWCHLLSFRLVYKGNLKFPCKNFFLLWMVESMNGDRVKSHSTCCGDHQPVWSSNSDFAPGSQVNLRRAQCVHHPEQLQSNHEHNSCVTNYLNVESLHSSIRKSLVFFVHLTAKFPLVVIFMLIVLYAIPASAAILALYILITVLFALPSFLILYFAYPTLDWLHQYSSTLHLNPELVKFDDFPISKADPTVFHLRLDPTILQFSLSDFRICLDLVEYSCCDGWEGSKRVVQKLGGSKELVKFDDFPISKADPTVFHLRLDPTILQFSLSDFRICLDLVEYSCCDGWEGSKRVVQKLGGSKG
ncbi:hypothetical protein HHK36_007309 [Tetracentron sinense]|uniref:RING-type domain-containing protein n=1 Tax=Tetracentron sinense TaxID=13715 RepID=A0A835DQ08_TETSI|nr:hypothetical protein HHK36_007309 [Tetracentron sinense]